ncbi:MAG: hypothetical protein WAT39_04520 [Planctomycetota bacterium]
MVHVAAVLVLLAPVLCQGFESHTPWASCSLAFDSVRSRIVAFGGQLAWSGSAGGWGDLTWEFDGSGWRLVHPMTRPPARSLATMTFDPVRNRTILFGGDPLLGDTWLFDGVTWTQVVSAMAPSARVGAQMVFDVARGRAVLVGGYGLAGPAAGTWEFDGTNWIASPAMTPVGASAFPDALAYDAARGLVIGLRNWAGGTEVWDYDGMQWTLASSSGAATPVLSAATRANGPGITVRSPAAVWDFDGSTWSPSPAGPAPYTRLLHDSSNGRLLCEGGGNVAATAGATWQYLMCPTRGGTSVAFDSARGCAVLYGGWNLGGWNMYDTWEMRGSTWTQVFPNTNPSGRGEHAMVYDTRRSRTVLFGGASSPVSGWLADTWAFDGVDWSLLATSGPSPRQRHVMVYDPLRDRVVLFGGTTMGPAGIVSLADTWEFDGSAWTQRFPVTTPNLIGMDWTRMTFDSRRGVVVMLDPSSQLWEYDGSNWTIVVTPTNPGRIGGNLGFDPVRGRVVAQGGVICTFVGCSFSDTFEYDGTDWMLVGPHQDGALPLVYDSTRMQLLGTAGGAQRITYGLPATASFTRHGLGCVGSAGTPSLGTTSSSTPALGTTFPFQLSALPTSPSFAYLTFGFDLATWNGIPLPIDLAAIGMPNCKLWVEPLAGAILPTTAGAASFALPIPALPTLAGVVLGAQALSFDAQAANGFGALSNGAILRLY